MTGGLDALLSPAERAAIRAPIERARTLPRRAFFDEAFYRFEAEHLLARTWLAVEFECTIAAPGSALPMQVLGLPVLLLRDREGLLRAFHNVCPYDGCEAAIEPLTGIETLETPYHGWHYALDGRLVAAPYRDGTERSASVDLPALDADLRPIRCATWMGTVFVALAEGAGSFDDYLSPVTSLFSNLSLGELAIGHFREDGPRVDTLEIRANWKTVYENYAPNVYHENSVHAMYRQSAHVPRVDADGKKTYTEVLDPSGMLGLTYDNRIGASFYGESTLPAILDRDGEPNAMNTIVNVWANWAFTVLRDAARVAIFLPEGPERGQQKIASYFVGEAAAGDAWRDDRIRSIRAGVVARREDNRICESIQRARRSPAVETQFYSPLWDRPHHLLDNLVLDRLEAAVD